MNKPILPIADRLISVDEAVELGLGARATIHRRINDGTYPVLKVGKRVMLVGNDILDVLEASRKAPKNSAA